MSIPRPRSGTVRHIYVRLQSCSFSEITPGSHLAILKKKKIIVGNNIKESILICYIFERRNLDRC